MINTNLTFRFSNAHHLHNVLHEQGITKYSFIDIHGKIGIDLHGNYSSEELLIAVLSGLFEEDLDKRVAEEKLKWSHKAKQYYSK